jgi:hypothetical protein
MRLIFVIAAVLLAACYPAPTVTITPLGNAKDHAATPDSVQIPLFTVKPDCPFEEIASITTEGRADRVSDAALTDTLKARTRSVGGNGIVNFVQGNRNVAPESGKHPGDFRVRSGTAVRFTDRSCRH